MADGACTVETQPDCRAADGSYQGNNTDCDPQPCPQPVTCENPTVLETDTTTVVEDHVGWFTFTFTFTATAIELCGTDFDTVLEVLADDCQPLLAGNDDCSFSTSFGIGSDPNASCYDDVFETERDSCL